ncbi:hypothetical protein CXB51_016286 [Gossypium anomalum]|uniref:Integrase catalytic domain-containing protein n=1 Tax=Gossypium anomalum TaxID=47600 RepID=A0A8J6D280_9ROSI|nr:hypothetical protein CXB51_016286 [Gossypium anomalum]
MKSTSGYFFTLGSGVFYWSSKKQQTVAQSTAEAKYIAAAAAINQAIWLRELLCDLNEEQVEATEIRVDNQSAVAIAKNPVFHGKTKHFKIKFHFVREVVNAPVPDTITRVEHEKAPRTRDTGVSQATQACPKPHGRVENDAEPPPLRANPTIAQIRQHSEDCAKKHKAMACLRDFENLKMKDSETIKQYSDRIMATVNNIRLLDDDFSEIRVVEKDSRDLSAISLSELVNSLYALEQRRANRQEEHPEGAFQEKAKESSSSSYKGKKPWLEKREKSKKDVEKKSFPPCIHCKKTTHLEKNCSHRPDVQCWRCKQFSHVEKVCKNKRKVQGQQQMQAKAAEDLQAQEEHVFFASCYATSSKINKNWLVDSGCSLHMASDERLFKNLDKRFTSKVRVGNGNLIELIEKGYSLVFKNNSCVVEDLFGQVLVTVPMTDRCFMLDVNQLEKKAYTSATNLASLWHKRLGHVSYKSLSLLNRLNLIEDMSKVDVSDDVCEVCQLGKQARLPFPVNKAWRAQGKLELVHTDICGPMKSSSLNDSNKSQKYLRHSAKFKALVENQSGWKIKVLRSDEKFQKLCEQAGIHHQLTTVYTPQQNGVYERKNRTMLDMARCLLFESKLPSKFWAEAVNTSVYLLNRLHTTAVKEKTPFEAWHDLKPTVSHLKVFGCVCYTLIPAETRTKLDKRSVPGIFVGYSSTNKGYRVYDPSTNKILLDSSLKLAEEGPVDDNFDEAPVRGIRTIADIYQRCDVAIVEPSNFEEDAKNKTWKKAMEAELEMIHKNDTWDLVDRPDHKKVIGVKWVFRAKYNADGSLNKHKARLVKQWGIHQLDVKLAFLNGFLKEDIFIEQPEGFKVPGEEDKVYKLKKALYGLKQAPRAWYDRVDEYLSRLGFEKSVNEPTLFIKKLKNETLLIVSLYVDDLLVTGSKRELIGEFKVQMQKVFEMTDLRILNRFCMSNCKIVSTPVAQGEKLTSCGNQKRVDEKEYQSLVGYLLYLTTTRPDIMYAVSLLSRFMHCCDVVHFKAAKRILRYVKGILNYGVNFEKVKELKLIRYSDSDWAGSIDDMKSTSRYFFTLGSEVFCWSSKKQQNVAQSTAEAKYIAAAAAINQAIWLRELLCDLNEEQVEATEIRVDNQSAVAIAKNPVFHGKTKHFKIKFHFVRKAEQLGEMKFVHCSSENQFADILTKSLGAT